MDPRDRELIRILWQEGRLSRWELHEKSGQSPNAVGTIAGRLIKDGVIRECAAEPSGGGRPRIPLEVDPVTRHVLGLIIMPGTIEVAQLSLYGKLLAPPRRVNTENPQEVVLAAANLLKETITPQTLAVGVSMTGLVDRDARLILQSSAIPGQRTVSLQPLFDIDPQLPIILANDVQSLAARWLLTHRAEADQDILLIAFGDGHMGATMLIHGRPNKGCVMACNELGHTRLAVDSDLCYCGQIGCLERICSTPFLHREGLPTSETLSSQLLSTNQHPSVAKMIDLVAMGFANCVNFIRPHRVVLVSELASCGNFHEQLIRAIRPMLLGELADRVRLDQWDHAALSTAETAGWAAMISLYATDW